MDTQILIATESFVADIDGEVCNVVAGATRVAADHPLAKRHAANFKPLDDGFAHFGTEQATAGPGEKRKRVGGRSKAKKPAKKPAAKKPDKK